MWCYSSCTQNLFLRNFYSVYKILLWFIHWRSGINIFIFLLHFVITFQTNQRIEILSWQQTGELSLYLTLQWHTRVVTALNWHHSDPNLLASCSIDTFTHLWDIRESRKPAISLSAVCKCLNFVDYKTQLCLNLLYSQWSL